MLRGGFDDVTGFLDCLIEEPEVDASGKVLVPGFVEYLEKLRSETWMFMQSRQ